MKKFNQNVLLDQKIAELIYKRDVELIELKDQFHVVIESVKPINIVKQTFSSLYNSPEKKLNILELATSFVGGYISKKIVVGNSNSKIKNLFGNVLQYGISTVINKLNKKKNMKKVIKIATLLLFFSVASGFAQETSTTNYDQGFRLGIGVNVGYPFDDPYDFNLGADARLQYDLSKRYSVTFTTGFSNLFVSGDDNDLGYIPVKAGFKAFVLKDQLYLLGEAGAAFAVTNGYDKTSLLISPGIGYATSKIDISLRYDYFKDFPTVKNGNLDEGLGLLSLRVAYGFKL